MLTDKPGEQNNGFCADYVVFDLETTGMSKDTRIIEIAAVKVREHLVSDTFATLVDPVCPIDPGATAVNHITDDMVKGMPVLRDVLPAFLRFIGDLPLAGHNIRMFDLPILYRECRLHYGSVPGNPYIDTVFLSRRLLPEMRHHRLTDLAAHYAISTDGAHRALKDCLMTQAVLEHLREESAALEAGVRKEIPLCARCGRSMRLQNGIYGEFWACPGFPDCRYTLPYQIT